MACAGCGGGGGGGRVPTEMGWYVNNNVSTSEGDPWTDIVAVTDFVDKDDAAIASDRVFTCLVITNYGSGDVWVRIGESGDTFGGDPEASPNFAELIPAGETRTITTGSLFGSSGAAALGFVARDFATAVSVRAYFYDPS